MCSVTVTRCAHGNGWCVLSPPAGSVFCSQMTLRSRKSGMRRLLKPSTWRGWLFSDNDVHVFGPWCVVVQGLERSWLRCRCWHATPTPAPASPHIMAGWLVVVGYFTCRSTCMPNCALQARGRLRKATTSTCMTRPCMSFPLTSAVAATATPVRHWETCRHLPRGGG